jgi:hypothetical protein
MADDSQTTTRENEHPRIMELAEELMQKILGASSSAPVTSDTVAYYFYRARSICIGSKNFNQEMAQVVEAVAAGAISKSKAREELAQLYTHCMEKP